MPLKVLSVVEQRLVIVQDALAGGVSVTAAAQLHGVSRSQLHVWLARYRRDGVDGLVPRSRRPQRSPGQISTEVEDAIVALHKQRRGRWGAKKIRASLAAEGWPVPAVSTVHAVLVRRGLITAQPRQRPDPGKRFERDYSNELWQIDGTCHRLVNGHQFWVVDILDDHSRFLLASLVGPSLTGQLAWSALRGGVGRYGLPVQLLSDNGTTFTGRALGITVSFERQVRAAGIAFIHCRTRHPQTLGKDERQHRVQNEWIADHRPTSLVQAQQILDAYRQDYNTIRPHEGIGLIPPAQRYQPGTPTELPVLELEPADAYPPGCLFRLVSQSGQFRYATQWLAIDARYAGIQIGLIRNHGRLQVYYGQALISTLIVGTSPHPTH
jgi:transposase InsO family protein